MNEELTPLEAFTNIKNSLDYHKSYTKDILPTKAKIIDEEDKDELQIIENALYDLARLQELFNQYAEDNKKMREYIDMVDKTFVDVETTKKKLKALEIIKNKCVDIGFVKSTKNYEEYINDYEVKYLYKEEYILTQEEFDLLKEVLL